MTTTQTVPDPSTIDVHPIYHLIDLAKAVSYAEEDAQAAAKRVAERVTSIQADLNRGQRLNGLGELQAAGPALDVAIAGLEQAAAAFRTGRIYLDHLVAQARLIPADPNVKFSQGVAEMIDWFDRTVAASPRATAIWESKS